MSDKPKESVWIVSRLILFADTQYLTSDRVHAWSTDKLSAFMFRTEKLARGRAYYLGGNVEEVEMTPEIKYDMWIREYTNGH